MDNPIIMSPPLPTDSPLEPGIPATSLLGEVILYTRYAYPLALFTFFLFTLGWWGIKTSQSSRPSPPSVNGIYENGRRRSRGSGSDGDGRGLFTRIAGRFPGGTLAKSKRGSDDKLTPTRKAVFNWLLVGVIVTFVLNSASVIFHALTTRGWWVGQAYVICTISLLFIYALMLISQIDNNLYPTLPHFLTWIFGICGESVLLAAKLVIFEEDLDRNKPSTGDGKSLETALKKKHGIFLVSNWEIVDLSVDVFRLFLLLLLVFLYLILVIAPKPPAVPTDSEESTPLLSGAASPSGSADYGASKNGGVPSPDEPAGWARKMTLTKQSWWEYLRGYAIFFPYLWPSKDRRLQFLMIICFVLVVLQRGVNVLVPHQLGKITDILAGEAGEKQRLPWEQIVLYITYRFLQGNMGVLGAVRSTLWVPIGQYSYHALSTSAFEHIHSLSLDFHLGKRTGEVLSALSKGNAINTFLEQVSFQVVPMLVDLAVAIGYFLVEFDAYYALIVAIVTFCYLYITVRMAQWRADIRREMVNKSREEDAVKNDSMVAYETVKYFNAEAYEFGRYRSAVRAYQSAERKVLLSLNVMNVTQNMVFTIGLVIACFLSAWQVTTGQIKVGRFVSLLAYLAQLQGPLNFFGTFYRSIQSAMINSERMLELFKEQPTVVDAPEAKKIGDCTGEIAFRDVHFSYDQRKPALRGLDFLCKPGTTTAFVGESGGGKTTVLRLLFRFYNIQQGSIEVDGQNVRDITIDSLRSTIGVVPQDTVLFNETVMYNLKYANPDATDEMVFDACRAASIHDKIMSFPDGYETKVGERGLRLSGGEKQRVAIARTILKNPKIILLDEATAALDSETEQHIQAALKELAKGRTTLVIAHRLSTITQANQILCLHEGKVIESGTHEELLAKSGRYAMMWRKQIRAEQKKAKLEDTESEEEEVMPLIDLEPSHPSNDPSLLEGTDLIPTVMHDPRDRCGAVEGIVPPSMLDVEPSPKRAAALELDIPATPPSGPSRVATGSENNSPISSPSRKGKEHEPLRRSGSAMSTASGGKWSAKGLRKALSMKGKNTVLHKRSASSSGLLERAASGSRSGSRSRSGSGAGGAGGAGGTGDTGDAGSASGAGARPGAVGDKVD